MTSLGLGVLVFGVGGLGGLGVMVVTALAAVAAYVDQAACELEASQELMDCMWHERVARFVEIFLKAADSATDGSLTSVLALGNRFAQWSFAEESKYSASSFRHSLSFL